MISRTPLVLLSISVLALTACGGGGDFTQGPSPVDEVEPEDEPTATSSEFSVLSAAYSSLETETLAAPNEPTSFPDAGEAIYEGFFSGELSPVNTTTEADVLNGAAVDLVAGDVRIRLNFANLEDSFGAIGNLQSDSIESIDGVLGIDFREATVANVVLFEGVYGGTLEITDPDYSDQPVEILSVFRGGAVGDSGELVALELGYSGQNFNDIFFDGDVAAKAPTP